MRTLCVVLTGLLLSLLLAGAAAAESSDNPTTNGTPEATPSPVPTADLLWQTTYGGGNNVSVLSLLPVSDGGHLLIGNSPGDTSGGGDLYLAWTDASGALIRESRQPFGVGGRGGATMASLTPDKGVIVVGGTRSVTPGDEDVFILRLGIDGTTLWGRSYAIGSGVDLGHVVRPGTDGGFMVAGTTASQTGGTTDLLLLKVDEAGGPLWHRIHPLDAGLLLVHDLQATADGGYLLIGSTDAERRGSLDILLMKFTAGGAREWQRTYALESGSASGYTLAPSPDGGYVLLGGVEGSGTPSHAVALLGVDTAGRERWRTRLAVENSTPTWGYDLATVGERGYLVVGKTGAPGASRSFVSMVDRSGRELWNRTYSIGETTDRAGAVIVAGPDRFVVAGDAASSAAGQSRLYLAAVAPPAVKPNVTVSATLTVIATTFATTTAAVTPAATLSPVTTGPTATAAPLGVVPGLAALVTAGLLGGLRRR